MMTDSSWNTYLRQAFAEEDAKFMAAVNKAIGDPYDATPGQLTRAAVQEARNMTVGDPPKEGPHGIGRPESR